MSEQKKPFHINAEAKEKTPIGAHKNASDGTVLGTVVVNSGGEPNAGEFILTLYNGLENPEPIATINRPKTGDTFPYNCTIDQGLVYTLVRTTEGTKAFSVTIMYDDLPRRPSADEHIEYAKELAALQNQRRS